MMKKLNIGDGIDIMPYLEGATIYSKEHPANGALKKEAFEADEVYIPEDVLSGERQWNLTWDQNDSRNKEGIFILKEK